MKNLYLHIYIYIFLEESEISHIFKKKTLCFFLRNLNILLLVTKLVHFDIPFFRRVKLSSKPAYLSKKLEPCMFLPLPQTLTIINLFITFFNGNNIDLRKNYFDHF